MGKAFLAAPLVVTLAVCSDATGPDRELAVARARWAQRGPTSYSITVAHLCFCLGVGPAVVTVRNGVVESRHYTRDGAPVPSTHADMFPSVEGLFEKIEAARSEKVTRVSVSYDPTFGYPVRIALDYSSEYADDEVTYEATDLVAR